MKTLHFPCVSLTGALISGGLMLAAAHESAASPGWAPEAFENAEWSIDATDATYPDDLGPDKLKVTEADLETGAYSYEKISENVGRVSYFNRTGSDGTYTGTYDLTYTSADGGTFVDTYTGDYTGFVSGTFRKIAINSSEPPVAVAMKVKASANKKTKFKLEGDGMDYPETKLRYKITKKPKVGKLILRKLPKVIYKPERGFKGKVKFRYVVIEGDTRSKPATVTLRVR